MIIGLAVLLLSSFLVFTLLSEEYEPAIPVVRIQLLLHLLIPLSKVLGIQWMFPMGLDRPFNAIILVAWLANLTLVVYFLLRRCCLNSLNYRQKM
ncbi:MAG: hypothetical protein QMD16_13660 [Desulfitobacteriaceae bacterium]|nr:hypothetical protein [Desulfitobacteriaceae bacterium]